MPSGCKAGFPLNLPLSEGSQSGDARRRWWEILIDLWLMDSQ